MGTTIVYVHLFQNSFVKLKEIKLIFILNYLLVNTIFLIKLMHVTTTKLIDCTHV
jgi:hypothetical protein